MGRKGFAWVTAFLALALVGCSLSSADPVTEPPPLPEPGQVEQPPPAAGPRSGGTLQLILDNDVVGLNPYITNDVPSALAQSLLHAKLMVLKPDGSLMPVLLQELPTVSEDGLEYTYTLKAGLLWSDGQPLTVDDVIFTVNAFMDPNLPNNPTASLWAGRSIEKLDEQRFRITLVEPFAGFLVSDSLFEVLPKHVLGAVPVTEWPGHEYNSNPSVVSGPFILEENRPGQYLSFARNEHYALGAPYIEKVVARIITDDTAAANALFTGEADFVELSPDALDQAKAQAHLTVFDLPDLGYMFIAYNLGERAGQPVPFFQDKRVRWAIEHAVDKQAATDAGLQGHGVPVDGPIPPVLATYYNPDIKGRAYDPEQAKRLLDEAGWLVGADGVREKDGVKFTFKLPVRAGKDDRIRTAQVWASYLKDVGIQVEVVPEDFSSVMLPRLDPPKLDFDAIFMGWGITADPDVFQLFHSSQVPYLNEEGQPAGGDNWMQWKNAEADELIIQSRLETDPAKRKAIFDQLQAVIHDDPPYYFLWSAKYNYALNNRVKGPWQPSPWGFNGWGLFWNIHELWLE